MSSSLQNGTVVMVHGAWADGSCWSNVILPLRTPGAQGHRGAHSPHISHAMTLPLFDA